MNITVLEKIALPKPSLPKKFFKLALKCVDEET
jgi:hypothetical protein